MLAEVLTSAAGWLEMHPLLTYDVPDEMVPHLLPGQLVAIPYGERLVEGIVWNVIEHVSSEDWQALEPEVVLKPIMTILDEQPALFSHQMVLAQWISEYYVASLAAVVQMMLPPGLMQRSHAVLRLVDQGTLPLPDKEAMRNQSPQLRALIGLLLSSGELDVEHLKEMLGPARTRALLKEARASDVIAYDAQLASPRAKARVKRVVRLVADDDTLSIWRAEAEGHVARVLATPPVSPIVPLLHSGSGSRRARTMTIDPWGLQMAAPTPPVLPDRESARAQYQLAALDLLIGNADTHWTPHALCKASGMTQAYLQDLVRRNILAITEAEVRRDPLASRNIQPTTPLVLTSDQKKALDCILDYEHDQRPILLHGVTGSGKTEVYLQALAAIIEQGKQGIMLVPEIALTTQAVLRVAGRFPDRVAIIHSELSVGERYDEWRRIRSGAVDVVIGSRSALFAPLPSIGLVILDEEHESAYKQSERRPTYHARETALMLGRLLHIPVVMGSATPAIESFYQAREGNYHLVELPGRIYASLPPVEVVDLRNELHAGNTSIISRRLHAALADVLESGQQAILFLNRRGAASCVLCRDCGYVSLCERCDIPLTYHATEKILLCHYCGYQCELLQFCPQCKSSGMRYFGLGTEKVQETIQRLFPQARMLRWDRDTARTRRAHEQLLDRFSNRQADILIGTQMIAKGLDLPGVTLVGVVSADIALGLPDYAVSERAFTLLEQVAGRAGRGEQPGHVIVQTFNPQHFCIETAARHAYHDFYEAEIHTRLLYGYPPFRRFVKFVYGHENRHRCQNEALLLYHRLSEWIERLGLQEEVDIVGPAPAMMERVRGKYRWQMILRGGTNLHRLLRVIEAPGWEIDIDPVSSL